jgi:heterotetrameric sarcosine oxidase gamma subunit
MLERVSALAGVAPFEGKGVVMAESPDFAIHEVWIGNGAEDFEKTFLAATKVIMPKQGVETLKVAASKYWCISKHANSGLQIQGLTGQLPAAATVLLSSRSRIALHGPRTRDVLSKCAAIDFHTKIFMHGKFVMTGIHHMPVLIHCTGDDQFHVYCLRTFALHLWEVLTDAAHS